jgi:hypothetical protein
MKSVTELIKEWGYNVWKEINPRDRESRQAGYLALFNKLKEYGYEKGDVRSTERSLIFKFTVPQTNKIPNSKRKEYEDIAERYIEEALYAVWPTEETFSSKVDKLPPPKLDLPPKPRVIEEPPENLDRYKSTWQPDQKKLASIKEKFKFEYTDEDLFGDEE